MRLIDADALIEAMKKTEDEHEKAMTCPSWWSAFNVISEQPIAYDIDKVVEELEEVAYVHDDVNSFIDLEDAIEIVKQGVVSDDMCQWKKHRIIDNVQMRKTSCLYEIEERLSKKYRCCPYCGKKIKVVE